MNLIFTSPSHVKSSKTIDWSLQSTTIHIWGLNSHYQLWVCYSQPNKTLANKYWGLSLSIVRMCQIPNQILVSQYWGLNSHYQLWGCYVPNQNPNRNPSQYCRLHSHYQLWVCYSQPKPMAPLPFIVD
jgi:hypothetical protein